MRFHGAMLFVKDLERMTAFYREVLGLEPVEETRVDNWLEFKGDGGRFALHAIPTAIAAGITIESPPRAREQGVTKLTFAVRDIDATLQTVEAMGLALLKRPWGEIEAIDPEGNIFAVVRAT